LRGRATAVTWRESFPFAGVRRNQGLHFGRSSFEFHTLGNCLKSSSSSPGWLDWAEDQFFLLRRYLKHQYRRHQIIFVVFFLIIAVINTHSWDFFHSPGTVSSSSAMLRLLAVQVFNMWDPTFSHSFPRFAFHFALQTIFRF